MLCGHMVQIIYRLNISNIFQCKVGVHELENKPYSVAVAKVSIMGSAFSKIELF